MLICCSTNLLLLSMLKTVAALFNINIFVETVIHFFRILWVKEKVQNNFYRFYDVTKYFCFYWYFWYLSISLSLCVCVCWYNFSCVASISTQTACCALAASQLYHKTLLEKFQASFQKRVARHLRKFCSAVLRLRFLNARTYVNQANPVPGDIPSCKVQLKP